jgi:hypothetical protein
MVPTHRRGNMETIGRYRDAAGVMQYVTLEHIDRGVTVTYRMRKLDGEALRLEPTEVEFPNKVELDDQTVALTWARYEDPDQTALCICGVVDHFGVASGICDGPRRSSIGYILRSLVCHRECERCE